MCSVSRQAFNVEEECDITMDLTLWKYNLVTWGFGWRISIIMYEDEDMNMVDEWIALGCLQSIHGISNVKNEAGLI